MDKISLVICDDYEYLCMYFKNELSEYDEFEVLGTAINSKDSLKLISRTKPDIALLDMQMESVTAGIDLIPHIKEQSPDTKIVMFSVHEESELIYKAFVLGVESYFLKSTPIAELVRHLLDVYNGKNVLNDSIAKKIIDNCRNVEKQQDSILYIVNLLSQLSTSEIEILKLASQGCSHKEIAKKRFVEQSTVRCQVTNILKKTKKKSMKDLIATFADTNVLDLFDK